MKKLKKYIFIIFILLMFLHPLSCFSKIQTQKIQSILDKSRIQYDLPAIALSLKLPNKEQQHFVSGYYSLNNSNKINANTIFQIGSITKTMTATIILKLIDENKLSLNQKIGKWLPTFSRWENITIRNLLWHTSGVDNYSSGTQFDKYLRNHSDKYLSLTDLANIAYQKKNLFNPGKKYHYTNTDYVLLGLIIEKVTKKPLQNVFGDYFHYHHLRNTYFVPHGYPRQIIKKLAHGYNRDGTFKFNQDVTFVSLSFAQSAGAVISTTADLVNWLQQLFDGNIISKKSLSTLMTLISPTNAKPINLNELPFKNNKNFMTEIGIGPGIGYIYFKKYGPVWVHSGGTLGYESFYAYDARRNIYLTLMYSVKPKEQLIFAKIAYQIFQVANEF